MGKKPPAAVTQSELEAAFFRVQEAMLALEGEMDDLRAIIEDPLEDGDNLSEDTIDA